MESHQRENALSSLADITITMDAESVDAKLSLAFPNKYRGYQQVRMPPSWRKDDRPVLFTFVLFSEELAHAELKTFFEVALSIGLPNPRPIDSRLLELSSLFHPIFYTNFLFSSKRKKSERGEVEDKGKKNDNNNKEGGSASFALSTFTDDDDESFLSQLGLCSFILQQEPSSLCPVSLRYYLQSLLFLSGCTLSAAIVQNRYSEGTIDSKLTRLWQTAQYAQRFGYAELIELNIEKFVIEISSDQSLSTPEKLIQIKKMYSKVLRILSSGLSSTQQTISKGQMKAAYDNSKNNNDQQQDRFGFVDMIHRMLGDNLKSIFVYGSAVTSNNFSDYDLMVIVYDSEKALEMLTGANPRYKGKELNMGVYDLQEFEVFQLLSGDNLDHNALCVFGEAAIVIKPSADLMIRNFSFAYVRLRQILGIIAYLTKYGRHTGLKREKNLYEYFIKIPTHIMKGALSVTHENVSKELLGKWMIDNLGYDLEEQVRLIEQEKYNDAIISAYIATRKVIEYLNAKYKVFKDVSSKELGIWSNSSHEWGNKAASHGRYNNNDKVSTFVNSSGE